MRKLLHANLHRLWINPSFWITVLLMSIVEIIFCVMLRSDKLAMDEILFISIQGIGLLFSVFFSLFLGTEYHDGTLRNKVIVGHTRYQIYIASFITGGIAISIIFFSGMLVGGFIGMLFYALPSHSIIQLLIATMIGWFSSLSYVSIFNAVGMLSSSKSKTSIICILTAFALIFTGMICYSLLAHVQHAIGQFVLEFNPVIQMVSILSIDLASPLKLLLYALILSTTCNAIGLYFFRRKDLK